MKIFFAVEKSFTPEVLLGFSRYVALYTHSVDFCSIGDIVAK